MNYTLAYGFLSLISGMICLGIAVYLAPYWKKTSARQLLLLLASISLWCLGYGMEFLSHDLSSKLWWVRVQYVGCVWIGVLMFRFICTVTGKTVYLKEKTLFLFLIVPILTLLLVLTNTFHGLMWQGASLNSNSIIHVVIYQRGAWFWGFLAFSYGLVFWATLILVKAFASAKGRYRKQLAIILAGIMAPWLGNGLYVFEFQILRNLDLTPFAFMVTGMVFAWGLFRYQLLNLIPLAHEVILNSMGDPVIVLDKDDQVVEINQACSITFKIENFIPGRNRAQDLFPGLYSLLRTHRKNQAVEMEASLLVKGIFRQWFLRISPLPTPSGKHSGWLLSLRDITEQKQTEAALRDSEEMHRTMLEASPTPIVYYSEKGDVTYVNPAFTRVFGWDREELLGKPIDFVPENQKQATQKAIERTYTHSDENFDFITQRFTKSKELLDVSINSSLYRDRDGNYNSMVVNYTDITQIKNQEKELRSARDYVRSIINSMPSILIGVDNKARVTQWNLEAEKITGIPADQARGELLSRVFPQLAGVIPLISPASDTQKVQKKEKALLKIGRKQWTTDITIFPIISDIISGAVIRVDDISERIKIEEIMVQSEKMMSVGGLAAGMAHEINNPLAGILQNTQVIQNRLSKPLPANVAAAQKHGIDLERLQAYMEERGIFSMMDQVVSVGRRAAKIVDNMLSFSRKSESMLSNHLLPQMMEATLDLVRNDHHLKKQYDIRAMSIVQEMQADLPLVPCENSKIQQVFFNILKNGAEAMSEAGTPSPGFVIQYFQEQNMACVEIRDNGPGMTEEVRKRIFEPFFTTKGVGIGTGLGLSVSYFIITENHKGKLLVESSPGKGTAFTIKLPF